MPFTCKTLNRRDNNAVLIAICCSYPWLFMSNSNTHHSSHPIIATVAALALVLTAGLVANFVCRKRRTAA
jgi:hypothetical protein